MKNKNVVFNHDHHTLSRVPLNERSTLRVSGAAVLLRGC